MEHTTVNTSATTNTTNTSANERESISLRITAIPGTDAATESASLWIGRAAGHKKLRKDLQLSSALPVVTAAMIPLLDAEKLAMILNDDWQAYIRRVKCQRLNIGDSVELALAAHPEDYAIQVLTMLSAPATRTKRLVSTASIRAMLLSAEYKAAAKHVMGDKLDSWTRIGEREFIPLSVAQDGKVATNRAHVRDNVVIRMLEIAALMPEGEHRLVMEAAAELLAELETVELDDSI